MRKLATLCAVVSLFAGSDLVAGPQAVAHLYDGLLQKPLEERQSAFIQLPGSEKSAVWAQHLLTALAEHPEFTKEQRDVIHYGLSILTPAFAEMDPADPQWEQVVGKPLDELQQRATAVFTRKQIVSLFGQLGPETPPVAEARTAPTVRVAPLEVIQVPQCQCNASPYNDFCDRSGVGFYYCRPGGCWRTINGCGWLWRSACEGVCAKREGSGGG